MSLEKLLLQICEDMAEVLNKEQIVYLQDVLFVKFHGLEIKETCTELQPVADADEKRIIDFFCASKTISGRQASSITQYVREIYALRMACSKNITDISSLDIRWYFGMCRTKHKNSMSTVLSKRRYLNSFYGFLVREGIVSQNPVEKIEPMKVEKRLRKAFTTENIEQLRVACGDDCRSRALIEFLLCTGVRISECCSLNVGDINFSKQEFIVIGKGNKERKCYLNDTGSFYLLRYLNWRIERESVSKDELTGRPLFSSLVSPYSRITKRGIEKVLHELGKVANVTDVHPHRFRRTYASNLASRGCPLQDLRILMGHSNVETTMIYCDIKEENVSMSYKKYGKES